MISTIFYFPSGKAEYLENYSKHNISGHTISLIPDTGEIYKNGKRYGSLNLPFVEVESLPEPDEHSVGYIYLLKTGDTYDFNIVSNANGEYFWKKIQLIDDLNSLLILSDWEEEDETKKSFILNKPKLHAVAISGDYNELENKPDTINVEELNVTIEDLTNTINSLTERLTLLEEDVANYHPDGITISVDKLTVYMGYSKNVIISVSTTILATNIKLYCGETLIYEVSDNEISDKKQFSYTDDTVTTPFQGNPIIYRAVAAIDGVEYTASVNVNVEEDSITRIKWTNGSISSASVGVGGTATLAKGTVKAFYASGIEEVVTSDATFKALWGTINDSTYTAPNTACNDIISVIYGGEEADSVLFVTVTSSEGGVAITYASESDIRGLFNNPSDPSNMGGGVTDNTQEGSQQMPDDLPTDENGGELQENNPK